MSDTPETIPFDMRRGAMLAAVFVMAECCSALDRGEDPRKIPFGVIVEKVLQRNKLVSDWHKGCREQLILMCEIESHRERANKLREALRFIAEWGGRTLESEYGDIDCNGRWCAEQAKEALK